MEDLVVIRSDSDRRVALSPKAAGALDSLLALAGGLRGTAELREVAFSLREIASMLDRIADRPAMSSPGAAYDTGWMQPRGS
jgi:hypothetical protein